MDLEFASENCWVESDMFDDLLKFAEAHPDLGDFGTSYDTAQSTATAGQYAGFPVASDDLLSFLDIEETDSKIERTPPHQPISAISPKPSPHRIADVNFFNTADELTQGELQDLLNSYAGDSQHQNSETLTIVNQTDIECDDKDNIFITENSLAEYFKGALSSPDGIIQQSESTNLYQCSNCSQKFNNIDFNDHICDYDENQILIKEELNDSDVPEEPPTEHPHPCIKQLDDNNAIIRKMLKGYYKSNDKFGTAPTKSGKKLDGPHKCLLCDRKFVHATGLARHMERHEQDDGATNAESDIPPKHTAALSIVKKCRKCSRIFNRAEDAINHLKEAHSMPTDLDDLDISEDEEENIDNTISIAEEPQGTFSTDPLQVLVLTSVLQCEFCEYNFSNVDSLLLHEASHDPRRGFECTMCEIHVKTVKEIFDHWNAECPFERYDKERKVNLLTYYVCNVCEHKFKSLAELYDHRYSLLHLFPRTASDSDKALVGCEICGELFDTAKTMIEHHTDHQPKKKLRKQQPAANATAEETGEKASKVRQYLCDVCGKSYTQSSHLWQHLRFHKGVKPFACKEPNCLRRFTIRPDLNDHIRKCHTGERPYHCLICGKRFLTGSVFYQHRLIHRGERRYGCEDCGKRFYRADALKNHQRIHSGEKPFACTHCQKTFRQRGDRDKHIRARHSGPSIALKENDIRMRKASALPPDGRIRSKRDLLLRGPPPGIKLNHDGKVENRTDVVYIGNMAFPTSMFKPMVIDIDA